MSTRTGAQPLAGFVRKLLIATVVGLLAVTAAIVIWRSATVLLLVYLAILLSILCQGVADHVRRWTGAPYWLSLSLTLGIAIGFLVIAAWLRAPDIAAQIGMLRTELPRALQQLENMLEDRVWGRAILDSLPSLERVFSAAQAAVSNALAAFSKAFLAVGYLIFVIFTFLFVAYQPRLYRRGIEALIPAQHRERAGRCLTRFG